MIPKTELLIHKTMLTTKKVVDIFINIKYNILYIKELQ